MPRQQQHQQQQQQQQQQLQDQFYRSMQHYQQQELPLAHVSSQNIHSSISAPSFSRIETTYPRSRSISLTTTTTAPFDNNINYNYNYNNNNNNNNYNNNNINNKNNNNQETTTTTITTNTNTTSPSPSPSTAGGNKKVVIPPVPRAIPPRPPQLSAPRKYHGRQLRKALVPSIDHQQVSGLSDLLLASTSSTEVQPTRRVAHILSEQKRREKINSGFDELKSVIPE
ncbi:hypothetical protein EDD21DRAFT_393894, partial [Dissophora ornata]